MNTHRDKTQVNKGQSVANEVSRKQRSRNSTFQFVDNRPEAAAQRKLQELVNKSPRAEKASQLSTIINSKAATIQRAVTFAEGAINGVRNVANAAMGIRSGPKPDASYGLTPSIFNGNEYPPQPADQLLIPYTIATNEVAVGTFQDTVTVPHQMVSWLMEVPTAGPWTATRQFNVEQVVATIQHDGVDIAAEHPIRALEGNVTVRAVGDPSDGELIAKVTDHESKHARNTRDVVNEMLVPWDLNLTAYAAEVGVKVAHDPLSMSLGLTADTPEATETVSRRIAAEIKSRDLAYHASPNGRDPKIVGFTLNDRIVTLRLRLANT